MEDNAIIDAFFGRDEAAIAEVERKYGRMLRATARGIVGNDSDAEECVNDTYLAAWNNIPPARPQRLAAYLCRIARNLACHVREKNTAAKRGGEFLPLTHELAEILPGGEDTAAHFESRELGAAIDRFLRGLERDARVFFVRRYFYADEIAAISALTGESVSRITSSLFRTRKKLKAFLEGEGFYI